MTLKRVMDVSIASIATVFLLVPLALIALCVRINLGSPILFRQERPGYKGKPFFILKFRTMTNSKDSHGNLKSDEERLTRFGQWLRASSLDELPEIFNVLRGEMSIVGPRPLLMSYLPLYSDRQRRRHEVLPGITGWAQVNGRNGISWEQKFELDVWYVDNQSFFLDVRIIGLTLGKVMRREGISAVGSATMPAFTGTGRLCERSRADISVSGSGISGISAHSDGVKSPK